MAKGKSTFCTWYCSSCKQGNYITTYNRKTPDVIKQKGKYCKKCRKSTPHSRKDTKS